MKRIDSYPTNRIGTVEYRMGRVFPFGATLEEDAVNFSIFSRDARSCTLLLYHAGEKAPWLEIPIPEQYKVGNVYAIMVFGLNFEELEYGYRMDGEYDPVKGLLFDKKIPLLDPYAKSVSGRTIWGREPDPSDPFQHRGRVIMEDYDWEDDVPPGYSQNDLVIYEMHVRGFTRDASSGVQHRGTFSGLCEKIPYLKELGINCVELLPVFEFDEFENTRTVDGKRLYNYWGYSTLNFFAPKAGYAVSGPLGMEADELKNTIKILHRNKIEVILDVVFNHTAEGNENGPVISYRGIDNRTYYMLTPDGAYMNFSGCGNTTNCNNAVVRGCILDCLRYWVTDYHIDGFRFDLASILTRDQNGDPMLSPPLLESLANDAVLGRCKLIAEAWDAGGLYQVGSFPAWNRWAEWNGRYRDCVRNFIKSGAEYAPEMINRISGSPDIYPHRGPAASVNFVTCHDGFTMLDLVSYNEKHNENNGEDNRDGANDNNSWNCGTEGPTDDPEINALRNRQIRNFFTILLTSRGVPMILSGDEFGNTQYGNNNAYCQDNEISWLNWDMQKQNADLYQFVRNLIAFRAAHPVLRAASFDTEHNATGYPELSFHGLTPWQHDPAQPALTLAYLFAEPHDKYAVKEDSLIYVALNADWNPRTFTLSDMPPGFAWHLVCESSGRTYAPGKEAPFQDLTKWTLPPRSSLVLIAHA